MADEDMSTEEVELGSIDTEESGPEEFSVGDVVIGETIPPESPSTTSVHPALLTEFDSDVLPSASPTTKSPYVPDLPYSSASIDDLRKVEAAFADGCKSFTALTEATGLDKSTVNACIKYLKEVGRIGTSGNTYCIDNNVLALQKQLTACQKCCQGK